jgi:hypothetical protein
MSTKTKPAKTTAAKYGKLPRPFTVAEAKKINRRGKTAKK